jgi:hypothetical protein
VLQHKKRQVAQTLQQQLAEEAQLQEKLAALATDNKQHLLDAITMVGCAFCS